MKTKKVELKEREGSNRSFYYFYCGKQKIGALKKNPKDQYTVYSDLPNLDAMFVVESKEEGISFMEKTLKEFIDKIT